MGKGGEGLGRTWSSEYPEYEESPAGASAAGQGAQGGFSGMGRSCSLGVVAGGQLHWALQTRKRWLVYSLCDGR